MGMLINIDNGGTLTDICLLKDNNSYKTKTLTTPYDLSKCFFDGLRKISEAVYGQEDVARLLAEVDHIRYSTTQGTNAIVERKGPRLGLVVNKGSDLPARLRELDVELYDFFVGNRVAEVDLHALDDEAKGAETTAVITRLTSIGANRIVVCFESDKASEFEAQFKRLAFDNYPRHLLGAVPMLFASELVDDVSTERRAWSAMINSFLHPAMESFLYNAENRLREYRTKNPLLIFRNDGDASRVAKTIALKTYSSGPRGGLEGVKTFSKQYNLNNVLFMDIGGTTTDIGQVVNSTVQEDRRGLVEGVPISFSLCEIASPGVGGSSILAVKDGAIQVGPESVGAVPGPACFGRGGKNATITDVNLLLGLLDPTTYFGGGLALDADRARTAIADNVATPLGISVDEALFKMRDAVEQKVANELQAHGTIDANTVLMAFGGAGPMNACGAADKSGISTVYIPKMAAVFSAFGIGSCDIGQSYSVVLKGDRQASLEGAYVNLMERGERDMFAEGYSKGEYAFEARLIAEKDGVELSHKIDGAVAIPQEMAKADAITLEVSVRKNLKTESNTHAGVKKGNPAKATKNRSLFMGDAGWQDVPVYEVNFMEPGVYGAGPAVIEEEFFTCLVHEGWEFVVTELGDIRLTKGEK
ncbi:hydantoinase/oxoprolinase family protein [Porticoccus sp.]